MIAGILIHVVKFNDHFIHSNCSDIITHVCAFWQILIVALTLLILENFEWN